MDKSKVETIQCWATPSSVKDVQRFLGFANFYRRFIKSYSKITTPLTTLTCKDKPFSWNPTAQAAFDTLKMAFTSAPVLIHPTPAKPFIVETDASDFALGAILSQFGIDGVLASGCFLFTEADQCQNQLPYDKGTPGNHHNIRAVEIVSCRSSALSPSSDKSQESSVFHDTRTLNCRQSHWSIFLADFDFEIQYQPDTQQGKADALSRRLEYELRAGDEAYGQQTQTLLKPEQSRIATTISTFPGSYLVKDIKMAIEEDT